MAGTAVCHLLEFSLSHSETLRADVLARRRRVPNLRLLVALHYFRGSPRAKGRHALRTGGRVIAPQPGQAPLSQRELVRPFWLRPRSRLASETALASSRLQEACRLDKRGYKDGTLSRFRKRAQNITTAHTLLLLLILIRYYCLCETAAVPIQTQLTILVAEQALDRPL